MNNIITLFQEIFMGKEDKSARVGLSDFRTPVEKSQTPKSKNVPKELKLSELMKKSQY